MKLSIVTTLYRSAGTIDEFYRRAVAAAESLGHDVEMIMVNDGSPDDSLGCALALHRADSRVTIVDLSRNFGHDKAMMTGLAYATGDLVFLIDSDLEEEPELLPLLHTRMSKGDCDVVYGFQERRRGGPIEQITGEVYYWLVKMLSDDRIPRNHITARLMRKDYVSALVRHRDREFMIDQLLSTTGFRQVGLPVKKLPKSRSTYSLRSRLEYVIRHLSTSSTKLLYIIFYFGLVVLAMAAVIIVYFLMRYAVGGVSVGGFTSLILSIWFFGGLLTLILGVQGIYLASIFSESKQRPYTVVREIYRAEQPAPTRSQESAMTLVYQKRME